MIPTKLIVYLDPSDAKCSMILAHDGTYMVDQALEHMGNSIDEWLDDDQLPIDQFGIMIWEGSVKDPYFSSPQSLHGKWRRLNDEETQLFINTGTIWSEDYIDQKAMDPHYEP